VAVIVGTVIWHEDLHAIALVGGALVIAAGIHVARQAR
jgi:drug/metabolite transporter (DMT)-like permease